jgi:hypothetical protein
LEGVQDQRRPCWEGSTSKGKDNGMELKKLEVSVRRPEGRRKWWANGVLS